MNILCSVNQPASLGLPLNLGVTQVSSGPDISPYIDTQIDLARIAWVSTWFHEALVELSHIWAGAPSQKIWFHGHHQYQDWSIYGGSHPNSPPQEKCSICSKRCLRYGKKQVVGANCGSKHIFHLKCLQTRLKNNSRCPLSLQKIPLASSGNVPDSNLQNEREQAVISAARNGDLLAVQSLLAQRSILNRTRGSALLEAVRNQHWKIAQALLNNGRISYLVRGQALQDASRAENLQIVKALLEHGPISKVFKHEAFLIALERRHIEILEELRKFSDNESISENVLDSSSQNERGQAVISAVRNGDLATVENLLDHGPISKADREKAFVKAMRRKNFKIAEVLLADGPIRYITRTLFFLKAVRLQCLEITEALLLNGDISGLHRLVAVIEAVGYGNFQLLQLILNQRPIIDTTREDINKIQNSAYDFEVNQQHFEVAKALLVDGLLFSAERGRAVIEAAKTGNIQLIKLLLARGPYAPISSTDLGEAVVSAAVAQHWDILLALLKHGPITDMHRGQALIYPVRAGNFLLVELLLAQGDISSTDLGEAVVSAAIAQHWDILQELLKHGSISDEDLGETAFRLLKSGYIQIALDLLADNPAARGIALQHAILFNDSEMIHTLFASGPILDYGDTNTIPATLVLRHGSKDRGKIAFRALQFGYKQLAQHLLANDPEARGFAIRYAILHGDLEMIHTLLACGPIPSASRGLALFMAARNGDIDKVWALLNY